LLLVKLDVSESLVREGECWIDVPEGSEEGAVAVAVLVAPAMELHSAAPFFLE